MKLQKDNAVYIKTKSGGRIAMNNLRPGDWLQTTGDLMFLVIQNSAALGRIEVASTRLEWHTLTHRSFEPWNDVYIGRGKKRWWYERLPRCLRKYFMPYSKPE